MQQLNLFQQAQDMPLFQVAAEAMKPKADEWKDWRYNTYQKYKVEAASLEDFMSRFYKADRYTGQGEEYVKCILTSKREDLENDGVCLISHHDSKTGEVVAYYGAA